MTKKIFGKFLIITIFFCMLVINCGKSNEQKPNKFDYQASGKELKIDLLVSNLKKSAQYVLCLNGKEGQDGNEALCNSDGKKYGPECYIDFETVLSDLKGTLSYTKTVPISLVQSKYDVTFLIKDTEDNYNPVFVWDHCRFEIK